MKDFTNRFMLGRILMGMTFLLAAGGSLHARPPQTGSAAASNRKIQAVTEETGFYCNMNALTMAERARHKELGDRLREGKLETTELPDGYAYRLQAKIFSISDAAEWVAGESKCCPFFEFEISLERNNGSLWLKLRGKDGVKQFMRSEFKLQ